jgi:hypothetical protein
MEEDLKIKLEQFAEAMADAAEEGDNKKLKLLIKQGADVNCSYDNNSPLHYAIRGNRYNTIKYLLSLGADPNVYDEYGRTPIHHLLEEEWAVESLLPILIKKGADVNLPDEDGDYPIQIADEAGYFKGVVQILLDCGAKDLRNTPSKKKTDMDDYYLAREGLNILTHDDRAFVLEISNVVKTCSRPGIDEVERHEWAVITRRNVPGFPPRRVASFPSRPEAVEYYKEVVAGTPRISLGESSPSPKPSIEEYTEWLVSEGLFDPVLNPGDKK